MTNLWCITPERLPELHCYCLHPNTQTRTHSHTLNKHILVVVAFVDLSVRTHTHTVQLTFLGGDVWLTARGRGQHDYVTLWFLCVWGRFVNSLSLIVTDVKAVVSWFAHWGCFWVKCSKHFCLFLELKMDFSSLENWIDFCVDYDISRRDGMKL